jgi:hypothetical protein
VMRATDVQLALIRGYRTGLLRRGRARAAVARITALRTTLPSRPKQG